MTILTSCIRLCCMRRFLTLQYTQEHGAIGLPKTKAFKRVLVHWTVEHFDWPGSSAEEMFRYSKVINEYEFPPFEVLHYIQSSA